LINERPSETPLRADNVKANPRAHSLCGAHAELLPPPPPPHRLLPLGLIDREAFGYGEFNQLQGKLCSRRGALILLAVIDEFFIDFPLLTHIIF
jgi:hypothetical protein